MDHVRAAAHQRLARDERRKVPAVAREVARHEIEHHGVAWLVVRGGLGIELADLGAELVTREARRSPHDPGDPVGADHRLRAVDVTAGGGHPGAIGGELDRGHRAAVADLEPARGGEARERVVELDPAHDHAAARHPDLDQIVRQAQRDRVELDHRHVGHRVDPLEHAKPAHADAAGADLVARVGLGLEQHRAFGESRRVCTEVEQRRQPGRASADDHQLLVDDHGAYIPPERSGAPAPDHDHVFDHGPDGA